MKTTFATFTSLIFVWTTAANASAQDSIRFETLKVWFSQSSRGTGALLASDKQNLLTVHCSNGVKSMQILNKQSGVQKTYIDSDFYCEDTAHLAGELKSGERISVEVITDSLPELEDPSKVETVVLEVTIQSLDSMTSNIYRYSGDGRGSRWKQIP